jgi:hypothetical protein
MFPPCLFDRLVGVMMKSLDQLIDLWEQSNENSNLRIFFLYRQRLPLSREDMKNVEFM